MDKENFPTELKRLRESISISQEEFAELLSNSHRAFLNCQSGNGESVGKVKDAA